MRVLGPTYTCGRGILDGVDRQLQDVRWARMGARE
jgi:hypothetical protein